MIRRASVNGAKEKREEMSGGMMCKIPWDLLRMGTYSVYEY